MQQITRVGEVNQVSFYHARSHGGREHDVVFACHIKCTVCSENGYANGDEIFYDNSIVENSQGFSRSRCSICTASLTYDANSFVPLTKLHAENTTKNSANQSKIEIIAEHKKKAFAAVRLNEQPVVVAATFSCTSQQQNLRICYFQTMLICIKMNCF